jgi:hypothetical protein
MVTDKIHCLTKGHEVLTTKCWKDISEITINDEVATLKDGKLVYEKPLEVHHYPHYSGQMYKLNNSVIDLNTTINHRMYINNDGNYKLEKAENIIGKLVKYKRNAKWSATDYQFILPAIDNYPEKHVNMKSWIVFIGIWIAEGWTYNDYIITINKQNLKTKLINARNVLEFSYINLTDYLEITNNQLCNYLNNLSLMNLPNWISYLSIQQSQYLIHSILLYNDQFNFKTKLNNVADDLMRIVLHAGWSSVKTKTNNNNYNIYIDRYNNEPTVNELNKDDSIYDYRGSVYCLSVPSEIFMVRYNGKPVWTGNSRGSNGPIVMLTRQCSEGRARGGGLRLGEMERDCFIGHGSALFLKEKMLDCADNYRVFICKECGMIANVNPDKDIYKCNHCKNATNIVQIRIPYAFKLLTQELYTMNVIMRYICNN